MNGALPHPAEGRTGTALRLTVLISGHGAMSRHYHCGQYERAYLPARMNIWEGTTNRPTTVSPRTPRRDEPTTKFLVNERGHLINRKDKTPHFKKLPPEGDPGATPRRWPTDPSQHGPSGSQSFPYSPRGNMGYKGIPSNLGHTNTIYLPTKCTASNTKGVDGDVRSVNNAAGPYSPRNQAPWTTGYGPNATGVHTMRRPRSRSSSRSSRPSSSQKRGWR